MTTASRHSESRAVSEFLTRASTSSVGLQVNAEAGMGKTTLWLQTCERAAEQGFVVLKTRGAATEVHLTFSGLADLLAEVDDPLIDGLPPVQRQALDRVLLRGNDGPALDERVAAAALLGVVQQLTAKAPVLVALDDVQWLDTASSLAARFLARRVTGRVGVLVTARTNDPAADDAALWLQMNHPDAVTRIGLAPLSMADLHALISGRLGTTFARPTLSRIHDISGGNPLYALELARALADGQDIDTELPDTLAALVRERVSGIDTASAQLLLAVACTPAPTVELVAAATGQPENRILEIIENGCPTGIVGVTGNQIRFAHPLLTAGVYSAAEPAARRDMHRRLAAAVHTPELKARHAALAAGTADTATLEALDTAAAAARDRGAPGAAAELLELAITLGGDNPVRRILLARHHFETGAVAEARRHLGLVPDLPAGVLRGAALMLKGCIDGYDGSFDAAVDGLSAGIAEVGDAPALRLQSMLLLAPALGTCNRMAEAIAVARETVELADALGDAALRGQSRAVLAQITFLSNYPFDDTVLQEALELQGDGGVIHTNMRPDAVAAVIQASVGDFNGARDRLRGIRAQCADRGNELDLLWLDQHTSTWDIWAARYDDAAAIATDMMLRAEQMGGHHITLIALTARAAAAAYLGEVDIARAASTAAITLAESTGGHWLAIQPRTTLAFLEVSLGEHESALRAVDPMLKAFDGSQCTEIPVAGWLPEAIKALTGLGRVDEAEFLVKVLEANGTRLDRPWMLAVAARGAALCHAARGNLLAAQESAGQALMHHDRLPMPFERARTQLVLGQIQRRRRRKSAAVESISAALETFEAIGVPLWAQRARTELARVVGAPVETAQLTPAEERVASRAVAGMSNREIAAELFVSIKTVEMNLSSVYRKLGIRSRTQLHDQFRRS